MRILIRKGDATVAQVSLLRPGFLLANGASLEHPDLLRNKSAFGGRLKGEI
jgi:hypothetical protein